MEAGTCFQILTGSNETTRTGSLQRLDRTKTLTNSFQKEMDKAFEKNQPDLNAKSKTFSEDKEKVTKKLGNKHKQDKSQRNQVNDKKEEHEADDTKQEQVVVAEQVQKNTIPTEIIANSKELQQLIGDLESENLLTYVAKPMIKESLSNVERTENSEIKLPFDINADLVKSAMVKLNQSEEKQSQLSNFMKNLVKANQNQPQNLIENDVTKDDLMKLKNLDAENSDEIIENNEMTDKNILPKSNQLDLSKINIKIAEAPLDTTRTDMAKQLADKILYKLNNGKHEFDLELYPRNLGKVNIKLVFQNGRAELMMSTSNTKAHHLLSMQTETLKGILENNTGLDTAIDLRQSEKGDEQFDRDNFQQQSNSQQNQQNQRQEKEFDEEISFTEKLRLGLLGDFEEAV